MARVPLSGKTANGKRNPRMTPPSGARERYVAAFMLGLALFFPPLLVVFDLDGFVLGIPALFFYLYGAWLALIVLVVLIVARSSHEEPGDHRPHDPGREP
ncbi:hypothetical protein SAMN05444515_11637 [Ectothiorhodospira marina]|uniref:Uncharacterized protein n=2 Tax=Ectothiorhodospiraceae TaxID=72276 RepID=A0A1H7Q597_9GAMM|nr:hypothetical protein SAMN05444515_11637 [Ectothiorhodospira marina]